MGKRKILYNSINIAVILVTAILFLFRINEIDYEFEKIKSIEVVVLFAIVVYVHAMKFFRLYLALYGSAVGKKEYLKTYCKTIPTMIVIPLKLGELFRMFCYGRTIDNVIKGIVVILLDRFMDTLALVTIMLLFSIITGTRIAGILYFLCIFLFVVGMCYYVFPNLCIFWKKYILSIRATNSTISMLRTLSFMSSIYDEISQVVTGRGLILFTLSLLAWGGEIVGMIFLVSVGMDAPIQINEELSSYLMAAIGTGESLALDFFSLTSIILMMSIYVVLKLKEIVLEKVINR